VQAERSENLPEQGPGIGGFVTGVFIQLLAADFVPTEDEHRKGWQAEIKGLFIAMNTPLVGEFAAQVAQVAAAVALSIGVEGFLIEAFQRYTTR
jgi:hypothetical protein